MNQSQLDKIALIKQGFAKNQAPTINFRPTYSPTPDYEVEPNKYYMLFLQRNAYIKKLNAQYQEKEIITQEDVDAYNSKIKQLNEICWEKGIKPYAVQQGINYIFGGTINADLYLEVIQSLASIFFEHIDEYNCYRAKPTTFFMRHFSQIASKQKTIVRGITPYDANNIRLIRETENKFHEEGITPTAEMVQKRSKLSPKVYNKAVTIEASSHTMNIDDMIDASANIETPEEAFINGEQSEALNNALKKLKEYNYEQYIALGIRFDPGERTGIKQTSYQLIADGLSEKFNKSYTAADASELVNKALVFLGTDPELAKQYPGVVLKKRNEYLPPVERHTSLDSSQQMILSALQKKANN